MKKFTPTQTELNLDVETVDTSPEVNLPEAPMISAGEQLSMESYPEFAEKVNIHKKRSWKKIIFYLIFAIICAGSIAFTAYMDFSKEDIPPFSAVLSTIGKNWFYIIFAILSFVLVLVFDGLKNATLLYGTTKKFRFRLGFQTASIVKCYDYVTPFGAGGQPFGILHMTKEKEDAGTSTAVILSAFFLQQITFIVLSLVALAFGGTGLHASTNTLAIIGCVSCFIVPALVILFSLLPKFTGKIVRLILTLASKIKLVKNPEKAILSSLSAIKQNTEALKHIVKNFPVFMISLLLSVATWLAQCSIAYFVLKTFGYDLPSNGFIEWIRMIQLCMILYISVSMIPTPGNAGASEVSFYFIFTSRLSSVVGFTALLIWRILSYYVYIITGLLVELKCNLKKKK